jgi:uncharacterized protein (TIGR00299 family) protein
MSWIVFDCPSGLSGDMTLGALVDLGVPLSEIEGALRTLPLHGWTLHAERVTRSSIAAMRVRVDVEPETGVPGGHHAPHRGLQDVLEILRSGSLSPRALGWAERVFKFLAQAEAKVHRLPVEHVHFHEVGAVDAIVDIAGACVGLDWLCTKHDVGHLRVSQLRLGRGQVRTEHGTMAVPAPAVLELLVGFPVQWSTSDGERVTPTGAAILAALVTPLGDAAVRVRATGYGAGSKEFTDAPNVLRLVLADPAEPVVTKSAAGTGGEPREAPIDAPHVHRGRVAVLQTTIDDMVPELFGHVRERLFAAGALDVQYVAVQAKKDRPATLVTVIARPEVSEQLATLLLQETTTLGVRVSHEERFELERRSAEVETPYGRIQMKVAVRPDGSTRVVPEYESVRQAADAAGVPAADVYQAALRAAADRV